MRRFCICAFTLLASGCATPKYLAKVNGEPVTGEDMRREFGLRHASLEKYLASEPEVRHYLEGAIDRRLLVQEAARIGLQDLPEVKTELDDYEKTLMIKLLLRREVDEKIGATEPEIQAAWELTDNEIRAHHVSLATREEAVRVRERVLAGEDIESLARDLSVAASAKQGGLVAVTWGYDEGWERNVFALKEGEVSPVFKSKYGWEVVKVDEHKTNPRVPIEKVRARIKAKIEGRKKLAREPAFLDEMRTKHAAKTLECDLSLEALRKAAAERNDAACATWDGKSLSLSDVANRLDIDRLAKEPPDSYATAIKTAVSDLLAQEYLSVDARARGLEADPTVVEELRTRRDRLLSDLILDRYVLVNITASDEEVKKFAEEHEKDAVIPESRTIKQFAVRTKEAVDRVLKNVEEGADFEDAQKDVPLVGGASSTLTVTKGEMPPEADPIFVARKGTVVGPMPVKGGFYFATVTAIVPESKLSPAQATERAREALLQQKMETAYRAWTKKLRDAARIEISDAGIRAYLKAHPLPKLDSKPEGSAQHGDALPTVDTSAGPPPLPAAPAPAAVTPAAPAPTPASLPPAPAVPAK